MATKEFTFDQSQILVPALPNAALNRLSPVTYGASLTIAKGQAMARKTSDNKFYPLNLAATDGTQTFAGFAQYACLTDSSGVVYFGGATAGANFYTLPNQYSAIWTGGIFDPTDLVTAATGTAVQEVDTITPTSPTTGDIYSVTLPNGDGIEVTIGATQTATAATTLLANAWNANPVLKALATTSGTATFILTAVNAGAALNLKSAVVGTGTAPLVITTAAVDAQQKEVDTFTASSPTTGDVYTLTITFGGGQTKAISATVGATQTATAIDLLLIAAWNADPVAAAYAVASGTTTLILTSALPGTTMSVAASVVGTGTMAKVVTTPGVGRNISDILPGCPGARILQPYGFWELP
jgi:hypothetical protein